MAAVLEADATAGEYRVLGETALRTITAVAFAAPAAAALLLGPPLLPIFVAAVALVMAWEWTRVTGGALIGGPGIAFSVALVAAVALAAFSEYALAYALLLAAAAGVFVFARLRGRSHALPIALGVAYVGVPALALLWLHARPGYGRDLVVWLIVVVVACDVGAYFVGRALKGPRLAPRISPGKTWSGAVGGIAAGVAAGLGFGWLIAPASAALVVLAALAAAVVAQIGDLLESALKRRFKVKDAGGILPGHGGMMDRVDGIVAAISATALIIWIGGGDPRSWL